MKNPLLILIFGLAFVFLFFGIGKLTEPLLWVGWIPLWMDGLFGLPALIWNYLIGVAEIVLAIALLVPVLRFWAALFMALHLLAIVIMTQFSDIGVRDIGLLSMALYLTAINSPWRRRAPV